jgi:hypothetical protein
VGKGGYKLFTKPFTHKATLMKLSGAHYWKFLDRNLRRFFKTCVYKMLSVSEGSRKPFPKHVLTCREVYCVIQTVDIHALSGSSIELNTVQFVRFIGKVILEACLNPYRTLLLESGESQI